MARPRSDIAPRIVHAARERFLLEGVDGASLRQIAADAGTSIGMVYYYFPTKDELFLAVIEEVYGVLLHELEEELRRPAPTEERLRRLYARFAAMSEDELTMVRLVVREALISSSRLTRVMDRFSRGHLPLILQTVMEGAASGEITARHHPAVLVASTFSLAMVPQVMRRLLGGRLPAGIDIPSAELLADSLHDVLMHGIAAAPASPPSAAPAADPDPPPPPKKRARAK